MINIMDEWLYLLSEVVRHHRQEEEVGVLYRHLPTEIVLRPQFFEGDRFLPEDHQLGPCRPAMDHRPGIIRHAVDHHAPLDMICRPGKQFI